MRSKVFRKMKQFVVAFVTLGIFTPPLATVFTVTWHWLQTRAWYRADSFPDRPFFDEYDTPMNLVYWIWISTRAGLIIVCIIALIATFAPMQKLGVQWCVVVAAHAVSVPFGGVIVAYAPSLAPMRIQLVSFSFLVVSSACFFVALRLLLRADRRWWHLWDVPQPPELTAPADSS